MEGEVLKYDQPFYLSTLPGEGGSVSISFNTIK